MDLQAYSIPIELECLSERYRVSGGYPRALAILRFNPADPYSVELTFYTKSATAAFVSGNNRWFDTAESVVWHFSRELLNDALIRPSGSLGVKAWPEMVAGHPYIYLTFSNRTEEATFRVGWWIVLNFMSMVDTMVSLNDATAHFHENVDEALKQILSNGTSE